jgi:hypothetical protein
LDYLCHATRVVCSLRRIERNVRTRIFIDLIIEPSVGRLSDERQRFPFRDDAKWSFEFGRRRIDECPNLSNQHGMCLWETKKEWIIGDQTTVSERTDVLVLHYSCTIYCS